MTSFEPGDFDLSKDVLDRTRGDDEFWDQVSELALLDDSFVINECTDHVPSRYNFQKHFLHNPGSVNSIKRKRIIEN